MRTIYAIQLQITPPNGQEAAAAFTDLSVRICQWVDKKYKRAWSTTVSVPVDGPSLTPLADHFIQTVSRAAVDSQLFSLDWTHPADGDSSTAWVTNCIVARHGDLIHVAILLRISTTKVVLRPVRFDLGRPRIVDDLLTDYQASIDGWPVPTHLERLTSPQMQS